MIRSKENIMNRKFAGSSKGQAEPLVSHTAEHPILFSSEMVRAIISDWKTQTRRVILVNGFLPSGAFWDHRGYHPFVWTDGILRFVWGKETLPTKYSPELKCPYGKPKDILWVRESFAKVDKGNFTIYKADGLTAEEVGIDKIRWKPSIHMSRELCRIRLEIKDIRVERIQEINESDIEQEGVTLKNENGEYLGHRIQFKTLWNKINEPRGFGWEANPFVWVVSFRRCG
jgi:hypothetical protein